MLEKDFIVFDISIHALRGEGDGVYQYPAVLTDISIHALRGEGDKITTTIL